MSDTHSFWERMTRFLRGDADPSLRERIEEVIEEHGVREAGGASLGREELSLLTNLLTNGDSRVEDIMIRRPDVVAIDTDESFDALVDLFVEAAHSRMPVFKDNLDHVTGMVHVKDCMRALNAAQDGAPLPTIAEISRPVLFVAPSMRALDLLAKMRARRTHMAIVVDEYGGTDGLITIEDLVEQVVGDIHDEHDLETVAEIRTNDDGSLDVDARVEIEALEQTLDRPLGGGEGREEDVDTVGGLVFTLAGRVPEIGEIVADAGGTRFEVLDADLRRITRLRVTPAQSDLTDPSGQTDQAAQAICARDRRDAGGDTHGPGGTEAADATPAIAADADPQDGDTSGGNADTPAPSDHRRGAGRTARQDTLGAQDTARGTGTDRPA
ncbi:hypothetical protein CCR85_13665 [Rhodothalassium salexigens]|uniref:hemolysin family protein n=1 Tax=Rhodothalassium salexigens TaxID=1086 RepID=UPI0019137280|nr:hemolysin family protein [Rhodothalassium salexigens]MBK5912535.1 hypothetical protein [Rhodothalassium salexigens]MBK5921857.1 hypothetical protein [Rhodothalassium salexigens]